jgi:hypothetical protein
VRAGDGKTAKTGDFGIVIGQDLTQRRKAAMNAKEEQAIGIYAIGWQASFSRTPLRLSAFA